MSRPTRKDPVLTVHVGEVDSMTQAAEAARVPLCNTEHRTNGGSVFRCTRAAGHDEVWPGHPGTAHVAADWNAVVQAVWR